MIDDGRRVATDRLQSGGARLFATILGAAAIAMPTATHAGLSVTGTGPDIRIVAGDVALSKVLSALAARQPLQYRSAVPLDELVTGIYSGSLAAVIPRLLRGHNYFIKSDGLTMEVFVIESREAAKKSATAPHYAPAAAAPPQTALPSVASRRQ